MANPMEQEFEKVNDNELQGPIINRSTISKYFKERFTTLFPSKEDLAIAKTHINPFGSLKLLTARNWNFFAVAFAGWTWDAFDFFAVSLNVAEIAKSLDVSKKDITWGITLVLMLRSVGAVIFGVAGDRYGRKYPFIINLLLLVVLQIATGFVKTYKQFLGVRAIFGIAMGGMFGNAAATAFDDCPPEARGVISGILQEGYAFGYLLVVIFNRALTDTTPKGWRSIFWFSSGPALVFAIWRLFMDETDAFKAQQQIRKLKNNDQMNNTAKQFLSDGAKALKVYWLYIVYLIIMMAGFNFMSHGSQDLFPTMLTTELGFGRDRSTVTNSVANIGAIVGGIIFGHLSSFIGRRLAIIICCIGGGAMIYPWAFVRSDAINAGVFFLQFFVQGAWGIVPIHISELSPHQFRAFITGTTYQLGNLASSASSTIQATIGERFPLRDANGEKREGVYNYSLVMAIFMGCVFGFVLIVVLFGPEERNRDLNDAEVLMVVDDNKFRKDIEGGDPEKEDGRESFDFLEKEEVKHKEDPLRL